MTFLRTRDTTSFRLLKLQILRWRLSLPNLSWTHHIQAVKPPTHLRSTHFVSYSDWAKYACDFENIDEKQKISSTFFVRDQTTVKPAPRPGEQELERKKKLEKIFTTTMNTAWESGNLPMDGIEEKPSQQSWLDANQMMLSDECIMWRDTAAKPSQKFREAALARARVLDADKECLLVNPSVIDFCFILTFYVNRN